MPFQKGNKLRERWTQYKVDGCAVSPLRLKQLFQNKKMDAKTRGIPFLLSFDEWLAIWTASGKLAEAGARSGQYVMARFADQGSYAVGNVKIVTCNENNSEKHMSPEGRRSVSRARASQTGKTFSLERRAKIAAALKTYYQGATLRRDARGRFE